LRARPSSPAPPNTPFRTTWPSSSRTTSIDDSEWRKEEQAALDRQYKAAEVEEAKAKLAAEEERQAELAQAAALVKGKS
jgi:regulator of protease activity HflC (stomatin/prohibitin superfamily)